MEKIRKGIIHSNILETMGQTPLVRLNKVTGDVQAEVIAKVEYFNPGGSVKDRIGIAIIEDAERNGSLKPGGTIVEATSGNTGVGLAMAAALRGYKTIFVMPDKMSDEKVRLLRAYGARVVITPTAVEPDDPRSYYSVANRLVEETPGAILANQYHNPANPEAHYQTTGPEIWEQTGGQIDVFVAGMGTGGTISGVGRYLKEQNPGIQIVGVDPLGSILRDLFYTGEAPEAHTYLTEGIGEDFLPTTTDLSVIDDIVQVNDRESALMARRLVREEGIFCGNSSGSAVFGALKYARQKTLGPDVRLIVLLPDSGSRYLSKVFNDDWMRENGLFGQMRCEATASDIMQTKLQRALITVSPTDRMIDVIELMKQHDISQVPVMQGSALLGVVREIDLLGHLLVDHDHHPEESVGEIIHTGVSVAPKTASLETLLAIFAGGSDSVMIVEQGVGELSTVCGILTKIDVLDYVSNHCI